MSPTSRIPAIGLTLAEARLAHELLTLAIRELDSALTIQHSRNSEAHLCNRYRELLRQSRSLLIRLTP